MKRTLVFYLVATVLISTAISGLFGSHHRAEATTISTVSGSGSAAPAVIIGDFSCSSPPGPAASASYELHFAAVQVAKNVSGFWYILAFEETAGHVLAGVQNGTLSQGTISSAGFNLTGEITRDHLCSNPLPTTMNITGQCGLPTGRNPNVEFRAATGETGSFLTTVFCSP